MARAAISPQQKIRAALEDEAKAYRGWLASEGISLPRLAGIVGVTPQAMQKQFRERRLTPCTIMAVKLLQGGKIKC